MAADNASYLFIDTNLTMKCRIVVEHAQFMATHVHMYVASRILAQRK